MFLSILGQNGAKTKTRSEAVLEARDARKARAEAGATRMHGLFFSRFCFFSREKKHVHLLCSALFAIFALCAKRAKSKKSKRAKEQCALFDIFAIFDIFAKRAKSEKSKRAM